MKRLLSIKIISQTPRNLSSFCSSKTIFSLPKRNPLRQINPNPPIPYSFAHCYATCSNSWRSRLLLSNAAALLKGQSKGLVNHGRRTCHSAAACGRDRWWAYKKCRTSLWRNPTMDLVVSGLLITSVAVWVVRYSKDPEFMRRNFTVSLENFRNFRLHTMITSGFNLVDTGKPILYMIGLLVFGSNIGRTFGGKFLLSLYLGGAFVGSVFFLVGQMHLEKSAKKTKTRGIDHSKVSGSGASGAVNAVVLLDLILYPKDLLYKRHFLYKQFVRVRVPTILVGAIIIGGDWWRIIKGDTDFSGAAHLGGALVATLSCLRIGGAGYFCRGLVSVVSAVSRIPKNIRDPYFVTRLVTSVSIYRMEAEYLGRALVVAVSQIWKQRL